MPLCFRRSNPCLSLPVLAAAWVLCTSFGPAPASAQTAPLLDGPGRLDLPDFEAPQNRSRRILPRLPMPEVPSTPGYRGGAKIRVERLRLEGNEILSAEELERAAAPWLGRDLSYAEISALRDALTLAYVDRGYVSSGAIVPAQSVEDGVLRVQIVEGTIAEIETTVDGRLREAFVIQGLFHEGQGVNLPRLEDRLRVIEQDIRVESVAARILPGEAQGESRLRLDVKEARPYWAALDFGNTTSPTIGSVGAGLRAGHRNVLGFSDALTVGYRATEGLQSVSVEYDVPVSTFGTRLAFRYSQGWSEVTEDGFALDIESETRTIAFAVSQPVYRTARQSAGIFLNAEHRTAKSFLFGTGSAALAEGSDDGRTTVAVLRAGAEWSWRNPKHALALRGTASFGLDALGATTNSGSTPDGEFVSGLFQAQWAARFSPWDLQLISRIDGQVADSRLLGLERFAIGGLYSVRGYRENQIVRDEGLAASVELRIPVWRDIGRGVDVSLAPFIDLGTTAQDGADVGRSTIGSAGLGLRVAWRPWLSAQLYWGQAFWDIDDEQSTTEQDRGVHFLFTFRPDWDVVEGWF